MANHDAARRTRIAPNVAHLHYGTPWVSDRHSATESAPQIFVGSISATSPLRWVGIESNRYLRSARHEERAGQKGVKVDPSNCGRVASVPRTAHPVPAFFVALKEGARTDTSGNRSALRPGRLPLVALLLV